LVCKFGEQEGCNRGAKQKAKKRNDTSRTNCSANREKKGIVMGSKSGLKGNTRKGKKKFI